MNTKNLDAAIKALGAEHGAEVADDELDEYLDKVAEVVAAAQALREPHKKAIARRASQKSRAKKAQEVEAMRARLAELEAAGK